MSCFVSRNVRRIGPVYRGGIPPQSCIFPRLRCLYIGSEASRLALRASTVVTTGDCDLHTGSPLSNISSVLTRRLPAVNGKPLGPTPRPVLSVLALQIGCEMRNGSSALQVKCLGVDGRLHEGRVGTLFAGEAIRVRISPCCASSTSLALTSSRLIHRVKPDLDSWRSSQLRMSRLAIGRQPKSGLAA